MAEPRAGTAGDAGRHDHGHEHDHGHGHDHEGRRGALRWLRGLVVPHRHGGTIAVDSAMEADARGVRALLVSLAGLGATAAAQAVVAAISGSVALLGDTLHNAADALTAVPLAVAFVLGRRPATRSYTYGYGRAEDLAGMLVVVAIAVSAAAAAVAAVRRLPDPGGVSHLGAVASAALVGFLGNELVARYRIRVGREIGSAALVADGLHARTDGLTSLAVLLGAGGVALGFDLADPIVGLGITVAILAVLRDAAREVYRRLMDAVDPDLVDRVEAVLRGTPGVRGTGRVRLRWIGHQLRAECEVVVDSNLTVARGHEIVEEARHRLLHELPRLSAALVHADPLPGGTDPHELTAHHGDPRRSP
ncbi:MAG TPA: cation diffusion facilitator family transporter [Actinomycetes bacterium]|jgi:cation diffusion facilitator family transporter|nr:cation diffusion facilitator family transporter [Actinomycetes bacterium]